MGDEIKKRTNESFPFDNYNFHKQKQNTMRQINNFEKEILQRIINYHNRAIIPSLASVIDTELDNKAIYLDFVAGTSEIRADIALYNQDIAFDEFRKLTLEIVTIVNLLKYLQDNGYLTLFKEANNPPEHTIYGQLIQGHNYISLAIVDPDITKLLLDYSYKSILVGQPLLDFANNGFRTENQIHTDEARILQNEARVQQTEHNKTTRRDLTIALFALVVSTLLSVCEIYHHTKEVEYLKQEVEQEKVIKLNDNQRQEFGSKIDASTKLIEQTNKKLDELKLEQQQTSGQKKISK